MVTATDVARDALELGVDDPRIDLPTRPAPVCGTMCVSRDEEDRVDPIEETLPEAAGDVDRERVEEIVGELAEMNSDDWSTFVDNGVADGARIEFGFAAPNEDTAGALADDLLSEGYEAAPAAPEGDYDDWSVRGATAPASVTRRGLAEWTRRLAAYGLDHDGCVLDGWAVRLD